MNLDGRSSEETLGWARKDAEGHRFVSLEEAEKACVVYVPNRVMLMLPTFPKGIDPDRRFSLLRPISNAITVFRTWRYRNALELRSRLYAIAWKYHGRGFSLDTYDYHAEAGIPGFRAVDWPTFGVVMGGHGTTPLKPFKRPWRAGVPDYAGLIVLSDAVALSPRSFQLRSYDYGVLYVHGCSAGRQDWISLASPHADAYVAGVTVTTPWALPTQADPPAK
jgi:hypothetical protein